jgi:hypothetical protein
MLQAWTPTTSACYDLSTVFVANGLAPHAYGSTGRQNYHSNKSTSIRNNSTKPHSNRKTHFHTNSNNNFSNSYSSNSSTTSNSSSGAILSTNGTNECSVNTTDNIANSSRNNAKHSNSKISLVINNNNNNINNNGVENGSNASTGAVDNVVLVSPSVATKTGASAQSNSSSKSHISQSGDNSCENNTNSFLNAQRSKGRDRERGRKRKEENSDNSMNSHYSDSSSAAKPANTKIIINSGLNEPFDLKATSFPPLPSSVKSCSKDISDNEELVSVSNHCSSLADVVKGTIKQRDIRCKLDNFDSINSSNGSKSEVLTASVHIITNPSFCQKQTKDIKNNSNSNTNNNSSNGNTCSILTNKEETSKIRTNSNSNLNKNQTSHDFDHTNATIPAKTLNHCPLQPSSSSCLGYDIISESSQENELKERSNTPVLNGINDSFSINSDSFDENNDHSSATQTQPTSPNSQTQNALKSIKLYEKHESECNGRLDLQNDENGSLIEETTDRSVTESDSQIASSQVSSKRLTYSEIAQRAKDKLTLDQNHSVSKDKESTSSNSSTSSKASAHLSNSGRSKFSQFYIF